MQFGAQHIAVQDFDYFNWLRPIRDVGQPTWYYWTLRETVNQGSYVDLSTVDPLLRDMVAGAQEVGVKTLPSCQGHFPNDDYLTNQIELLREEEHLIREGRLLMENVETGRVTKPRYPKYRVPPSEWLRHGVEQAMGCGRVGFVFEHRAPAIELTVICSPLGRVRCDGTRVSIQVFGRNQSDLRFLWSEVEKAVFSICEDL